MASSGVVSTLETRVRFEVEDYDPKSLRRTITTKNTAKFQKKSKSGINTPAVEIERVKSRLKEAEKDYVDWTEQQKWEDQDHH